MSSIVFGLCLGYGLAFALGKVNMSALNVEMLMSFNIPQPFKYGIDLISLHLLPLAWSI